MRRFLYFIPGHSGANPKTLALFQLLDRFTCAGQNLIEHCVTGVSDHPKGHGCIVAAGTQPPPANYAQLNWITKGGPYVAIEDPQLPPRPQDLERELGIAGENITLADGQEWRVPLIRKWDSTRLEHASNLPKTLQPNSANGKTTFGLKVKPEFEMIDALADRLINSFSQEESMPLDQACADAVQLLRVNYRIGIEEAGLLGLLDAENVVRMLSLSIDYAAIAAQAAEFAVDGLHAAEPVIEEEES